METLGLNPSGFAGPERRDLTPEGLERRRQHVEEHGEGPGPGAPSFQGQVAAYFGLLPKRVLAGISAFAIVVVGTAAVAWKSDVDVHLKGAPEEARRLKALESDHHDFKGEMRTEVREIRRQQLEDGRWMAIRMEDASRARELDGRLKALEAKKP